MALFLPNNVAPLSSASTLKQSAEYSEAEYFTMPKDMTKRSVEVGYVQLADEARTNPKEYLSTILKRTPKPKGRYAFSNVHIVGPDSSVVESVEAEATIAAIQEGAKLLNKDSHLHRLSAAACKPTASSMEEYNAIFETASKALLEKADRASLLVFVGWEDVAMDAYAAFIGMLPFRGVQVALISRRREYGDLMRFATRTGTFDLDGLNSARMGKFTVHTVFGALPSRTFQEPVRAWQPVDISSKVADDADRVVHIPFKIGGLKLPMLTHNGQYTDALAGLADVLAIKYPKGYTPIVSCGETCDALGYGQDMLDALNQEDGLLFTHKSGETYKRYDNYGTKELFDTINAARSSTAPPVIIALGGGVNGNCIGLIAAMTNVDFVEVPTTPMHYNDAVTSAKKAFSLVVDDTILSKNILGAFYLPQLAYCVNECLLTISSANAYATVGESCKTMNMLGISNSAVGAKYFSNILGAEEFASDFTKILSEVGGFDALIDFIERPSTLRRKRAIIALGKRIAAMREGQKNAPQPSSSNAALKRDRFFPSMPSLADSNSGSESSSSDSEEEEDSATMEMLIAERRELMNSFRKSFHALPVEQKDSILSFLTVINAEIVAAKAMFLAYSDPFEKYRALLFEYAHTLGHGVEAFANDLYLKARRLGVEVDPKALRLHGQCVGMAVLWAGEMSKELGELTGKGYTLHQSFPYLFNRNGGFSFQPLRDLCDELNVGCEEFCEKVLKVVRRDNKRGYCSCSDPKKSVDQLVACRPGKMLSSEDPNAEVRYLVEVDEDWQKAVLEKAFEGYFDRSADLVDGEIKFVQESCTNSGKGAYKYSTSSNGVASYIRAELLKSYAAEEM